MSSPMNGLFMSYVGWGDSHQLNAVRSYELLFIRVRVF
jgi:hypothetical protein